MLKFMVLVAAACVAASPLYAQPPRPPRTDVPIRRVVLFSSGVGYFEHDGSVRGSGTTELRFKADQINDVLKSLVLQDRDGGHVAAVTYPSRAPLSKTLRSFQVDITANPSMAELLNQLRGAKVTIAMAGDRIAGTILGVEERQKAASSPGAEPVAVPVLDLLNGATIRAIELSSITSLSLDDPQLEEELTKALSALAQARDQDKKPVSIAFNGTGDRRVRIGYVVESPVWKTSYRLVLSDKRSQLQGWAIVENQTESDWDDVSLSLVSGRPISFTMDLYQPLYATRPNVVPEMFAGLRPQVYEEGLAANADSVSMTPSPRGEAYGFTLNKSAAARSRTDSSRMQLRGRSTMALSEVVVTGVSAENDIYESVRSIASSANLGELFEYSIGDVSLPRQKSAMLPIIADSVGVERVSIYNASVLPRNALTGVRVKNTTGKLLLQGPITVIDKNTYAGDARIDDVPAGQERLLSYGIDLELVVDATKNTQTDVVTSGKIVKGVLSLQRKVVAWREYDVDNKSTHDKTLVIEHPVRPGWKLVDTQAPVETTPTVYRFQGNVAAGKVTKLPVKEEFVRGEWITLTSADPGQLLMYAKTGELSKSVRDALARAIELRQRVADVERQINDRAQQLGQITQEQTRIREDMKAVAQSTSYYARLLAKLNDQESTIERLQKERDDLLSRRDQQKKELDDYLTNLVVD